MLIKKVSIKNFRNLEDIEVEVNGGNLLLLGDNNSGKSSFLNAIRIALGDASAVGVDQVMHGKQESVIQVVTDDKGNEYKFKVKFKEGSDKPTIEVRTPNGLKNTAKSVIGGLTGEISFDVDAFVQMSSTDKGRKEQVEIVKSFLAEDVRAELFKHERKIQMMFEDRQEINRQIKTMDGFIRESDVTEDDMKVYFLKEDTEALTKELNDAIYNNANVDKSKASYDTCRAQVLKNSSDIEELRKKITKLEIDSAEQLSKMKKIDIWQKENPVIDITALQEKAAKANAHNLKHQKVNDVRTQIMKKEEAEKESENFTVLIETTRQLVSDTIKDLEMPIEGLLFTEEHLTYNGEIVSESTLSTSDIMMLGVKLKMAKNPNAKVLCLERGESLGSKKLKQLQQMCKQYGYQIFMEQVKRGQEELTIEIMPD